MIAKGASWAGPSLYYYVHLLISEYISCDRHIALAYVNNKTVLFYITVSHLLLNQYISDISNLYNPDKNLSLESQNELRPHFSDPKSDHILYIFGYIPGLYMFFLLYV